MQEWLVKFLKDEKMLLAVCLGKVCFQPLGGGACSQML